MKRERQQMLRIQQQQAMLQNALMLQQLQREPQADALQMLVQLAGVNKDSQAMEIERDKLGMLKDKTKFEQDTARSQRSFDIAQANRTYEIEDFKAKALNEYYQKQGDIGEMQIESSEKQEGARLAAAMEEYAINRKQQKDQVFLNLIQAAESAQPGLGGQLATQYLNENGYIQKPEPTENDILVSSLIQKLQSGQRLEPNESALLTVSREAAKRRSEQKFEPNYQPNY